MLTLILKEGAAPVTLQLSDDVIAIGRSKENNIVLKNIKSSRRHARIERVGATYQITDLGSGNGTKVNGKKIDFETLKKGDEIAIGDARITLKAIDDGPDALDAADDDIKIQEDTDVELKVSDDVATEKIEWSEAETEVQAPSVKAKAAPAKPGAKPAAAPAPAGRPGLKKPLGKPGQK
jgi:pSer/pThr/pTyr-binding forkhead associated (FHA) protein